MAHPQGKHPAVAIERDIGQKLETCQLGGDCPFEPALRQLSEEQHDRIKSEGALATQIDAVLGTAKRACLDLEELSRRVREIEFQMRMRRLVDLAIMSIGASLGGFLAKLFLQ